MKDMELRKKFSDFKDDVKRELTMDVIGLPSNYFYLPIKNVVMDYNIRLFKIEQRLSLLERYLNVELVEIEKKEYQKVKKETQ